MHALVAPGTATAQVDGTDPAAAAVRLEPDGVTGVPSKAGTTGAIGPGTLLWSEAANANWKATVDNHPVARRDAFAWTNAFALDGHAPVHVRYAGRGGLATARLVEIGLWIVAVGVWFATRRRRAETPAGAAPTRTDPEPTAVDESLVGA